jgi:hypothetical protein
VRLRALELAAFSENQRANFEHVMAQDLLAVSRLERRAWAWLGQRSGERQPPPRTPYWGLAPGQA